MTSYTIEQFVTPSNQYEKINGGEFESKCLAIDAMISLEEHLGWTQLRVIDCRGIEVERSLT